MSRDMTELDHDELAAIVAGEAYPLVFATVSGAHLYGFPSRDSDVDLRGVHLLPTVEVVGLRHGPQTLDRTWIHHGAEIDLVTHDLEKFCRLLLRRNGNLLEQLTSPLLVTTSDAHAELVDLVPDLLTTHHAHHYRGFAATQWDLFGRNGELKPLLYTLRVLLTGIHLMRTGAVEADLRVLRTAVAEAPAYLADLMAAKADLEHGVLDDLPDGPDRGRLTADVTALHAVLDSAQSASRLAARPSAADDLHRLLVRTRLDRR